MREKDILKLLGRDQVRIPPLSLKFLDKKPNDSIDAILEARYKGQRFRFAAEVKARSAPVFIQAAVESARTGADPPRIFPMIVVPYLSEDQLLDLEKQEVSGIDLCGNGLVVVPGRLFVFRTGKPNRYRENAPIKNAFRGKVSLAGRVFLLRPRYGAVNEILEEVTKRGGSLAISSVSKVVRRLEEELIVGRQRGVIRLLQPDKLLEGLAREYQKPSFRRTFLGRTSWELERLVKRLSTVAQETDSSIAVTGSSSVSQYAVMAREQTISLYCSDIDAVVSATLKEKVIEETDRFTNIRILETSDDLVYFDVREKGGIPWASPIQTYVELMAGDKRDRETASQVAETLLKQMEVSRV
jgi:hypothetical protein